MTFHKNSDVTVDGIFYIELEKRKVRLDVISGRLKAMFYVKEFINKDGIKLTLYCKLKDELKRGDIVFINNQVAPNKKYKFDDFSIYVKDGVVNKINYYSLYVVVTLVVILIVVIVAF